MPSCVYKLAQGSVIKPRPQKSPSAQKEDCTSAKKNQIVFVYTPRTPIRQITRVLRFERLRFFNKLHVFNGREYSDSSRLHHSDWGSGVSCDLTGRVFRTESLLHFFFHSVVSGSLSLNSGPSIDPSWMEIPAALRLAGVPLPSLLTRDGSKRPLDYSV